MSSSFAAFVSKAIASIGLGHQHTEAIQRITSPSMSIMHRGMPKELVAILLPYLDATSIRQLQCTCRVWRQEPLLWASRIKLSFNVEAPHPSARAFLALHYDLTTKELRHTSAIIKIYSIYENYCRHEREHGLLAMFCDICTFDDPLVAQAIAKHLGNELAIVFAESSHDVMKFRKLSLHRGQIKAVAIDISPYPSIEPPPIDKAVPGLIGFALHLVKIDPAYEHLRYTAVGSILQHVMVFTTQTHARRYRKSVQDQQVLTVALDDGNEPFPLCFSTRVRRQLQDMPIADRHEFVTQCTIALQRQLKQTT